MHDYKKIKKQIQAEAELHETFGDEKIITFCMREIFHGNLEDMIEFLTSDDGGFEEDEIERAINKIHHNQKNYYKKLKTGLQVS